MTIASDLNTINENFEQAKIALKYRRIFDDIYDRMKSLDSEIEIIASDVKFTAIPTNVKQALNAYWQIVKQFNAAIENDENIMELLKWR